MTSQTGIFSSTRFDRMFPVVWGGVYFACGLYVSLRFSLLGDLGVEADFFSELAPAAQRLAAGEFAVANYPYKGPLYSLALVAAHAVGNLFGLDWYRSAVFLNLTCAVISLALVYRLVLRLTNRPAAICATLLTGVVYEFFVQAHKASSDMLFLLLILLSVDQMVGRPLHRRRLLVSGGLAGLAFLTRYIGGGMPIWATMVLLFIKPVDPAWRRRLAALAIWLAGMLMVCVPWLVVNLVETGSLLPTENLQNMVAEFYGGSWAPDPPEGGFQSAGQLVSHDPAHFISHFLGNFLRHAQLEIRHLLGPIYGWLAVAGLLFALVRRPGRETATWLLFGLVSFSALRLVFYLPRFSLPVVPVYATLVAGLLFGYRLRRDQRARRWDNGLSGLVNGRARWSVLALAMTLAAAAFVYQVPHIVKAEKYYSNEQPIHLAGAIAALARTATEWPGDEPPVLMARKAHAAHYSGCDYRPYPRRLASARELLQEAARRKTDFIIVGVIERQFSPAPYLDHLDRYGGIERIYDDGQTVVFQLHRDTPVEQIGVAPDVAAKRAALEAALAGDDRIATYRMAAELGSRLVRDGELAETRAVMDAVLAALSANGAEDQPLPADEAVWELRHRVDLSAICFNLSDHATGIAVLAEHIARLAVPEDPQLSAHAHFTLGRHYAAIGERAAAVRHVAAARDLFVSAGESDRAAGVDRWLQSLEQGPD